MEIARDIGHKYLRTHGYLGYVAYWLAVARVKIQGDTSLRDVNIKSHDSENRVTPDDPEPDATFADCVENARASLVEAEKLPTELGAGPQSGLGQLLGKSRKALADFEAEH